MSTKDGLLREFATVLQLPEWFGHNWDALVDVLKDCWYDTPERRVLVFHRAQIIGSDDADAFAMFMSILRSVVSEARAIRRWPIHVTMLADDPEALASKIVHALEHDTLGAEYAVAARQDVLVSE